LPDSWGDRPLIRQVFTNLFSNAIKYSRHQDRIEIEVGGFSKNGENIYFVRDHGIGFDMKYADKLFCVFQRLHDAEQFEGTGVGLAIVRRIVSRHGGRVWAEAELNKGATFYFSLPGKLSQHEVLNGK
jgi:light-regulated signal transduction histidine kinase (bacteriophytochrome)